jgi:putative transposase
MRTHKLIGNLKSVSSRKMNQEFPEHLGKTYYPKISRRTGKRTAHTLWNESYAINSVGGARLDVLIGYIKNQPKELLDKVTRGNF